MLLQLYPCFMKVQHQGRYSYEYGADINGDGINSDLVYIPANNGQINFEPILNDEGETLFTAADQLAAFNRFVNEDPYLSENKRTICR